MLAKSITKAYFDERLDNLALAIARGFEATATKTELIGVENRLEKVEVRLDGVELRLDKVETRLDGMESKLNNVVYKKLDQNDARFTKIEKHLKLNHVTRE